MEYAERCLLYELAQTPPAPVNGGMRAARRGAVGDRALPRPARRRRHAGHRAPRCCPDRRPVCRRDEAPSDVHARPATMPAHDSSPGCARARSTSTRSPSPLLVLCCASGLPADPHQVHAVAEIPPLWQAALRSGARPRCSGLWCRVRGVPLFARDGTRGPGCWRGAVLLPASSRASTSA